MDATGTLPPPFGLTQKIRFNGVLSDARGLQLWIQFEMEGPGKPVAIIDRIRNGSPVEEKRLEGSLAECLHTALVDLIGDDRLPPNLCRAWRREAG